MFGDLDVDQVLYSAARLAVQAAEINAAKRALQATAVPGDADAVRVAPSANRLGSAAP